MGGVSGALMVWAIRRAMLRELRFANSRARRRFLTERPARTAHKACALGNVGSLRCDPVLAPHHYFLRYSFLPIRPKCDCGHRFSFSPSLSLATATSDLGPGHGTESREKVISQSHDEARAGNDHRGSLVDRTPHR